MEATILFVGIERGPWVKLSFANEVDATIRVQRVAGTPLTSPQNKALV